MHGRWRWCEVSAILLASLAAAAAEAQLLKFTGDAPPPAAGTGADARTMADALDKSMTDIRARGQGPGFDAAIGLRRLARDLARDGEKSGAAGSFRLLASRTIANNLVAFDEILLRGDTEPSSLEMVAAALAENSPNAPRFTAAGTDELDRLLRDALAPLLDATGAPRGPWGWVADPPAPPLPATHPFAPELDAWSRIPGVTPEAIAALRRLDETLTEGERWAAYHRSALALRADVRSAAAALASSLGSAWLSPEAKSQFVRDFCDAALALGAAGTPMDAPRAEIRRLVQAGRVAAAVDKLPADPTGKKVRTTLSDFFRTRTPDRDAEHRSLDAFDRSVASVLARSDYSERRALVRHLRPAWKVLDKDCQSAERAVIDALPKLLQFESAVTDPAVLTAIAAHQRALDDLESLYSVSARLLTPRTGGTGTPGVPVDPRRPPAPDNPRQPGSPTRDTEPAAGWKSVADRLLKVSQDLNKPESHDAALDQFRAFASRFDRFSDLPGEAEFRASSGGSFSPPGWGPVTGGRAAELPAAIAAAREAWLQGFIQDGTASDSARLELLETLMGQLSAGAAIQSLVQGSNTTGPGRGRGALQSWPGWEASSRVYAALLAPARDGLAQATALVLTGSDAPAGKALADLRKNFPALLLAGRLERRAPELGLVEGVGPQSATAELAAGAPLNRDAWLISQREDLAHICRYAEEWASPQVPTNPGEPAAKPDDIRKSFAEFANSRARRVLDALDRASP